MIGCFLPLGLVVADFPLDLTGAGFAFGLLAIDKHINSENGSGDYHSL
jgi:hypothetical protein